MRAGSGVIIDAEKGYVLTNLHVEADAGEISVTLKDRRRFTAKLVGSDKETDIPPLKIDCSSLTVYSATPMLRGETVVAMATFSEWDKPNLGHRLSARPQRHQLSKATRISSKPMRRSIR
jgi:hypothetical protein